MQRRNDYEKKVYNGDVGIVWAVNENKLFVRYYEKEIEYTRAEWGDLQLAYASKPGGSVSARETAGKPSDRRPHTTTASGLMLA